MSDAWLAFLLFVVGAVLFTAFYVLMGVVFLFALVVGVLSSALLVYGGWFVLVILESDG